MSVSSVKYGIEIFSHAVNDLAHLNPQDELFDQSRVRTPKHQKLKKFHFGKSDRKRLIPLFGSWAIFRWPITVSI